MLPMNILWVCAHTLIDTYVLTQTHDRGCYETEVILSIGEKRQCSEKTHLTPHCRRSKKGYLVLSFYFSHNGRKKITVLFLPNTLSEVDTMPRLSQLSRSISHL